MKHIRNRIFIQILIPTCCIFLIVIVGGLIYVNRSYEGQVITQKSNELDKAARAVHNWLVSRISNMIQLSRTPLIKEGNVTHLMPFLKEERKRLSFIYDKMFYINPDGSYQDTDGILGKFEEYRLIDYFLGGNKLFFYDGPLLNKPNLRDSVLIAVPVQRENNISAVLAATIPLSTFKRVVGYFTMEEFEDFMLVNPRSIIIVHSDLGLIGKSERGEYGMAFSADTQWKDKMVFVSVLRTTWKLVGFVPIRSLLKPVHQINRLVVFFFISVMLLLFVVSLAISMRIDQPIRKLTEGVHRIMEGDYKQRISVNTKDELNDLADAFNKLSERLIKLRTDDRFLFLGHVSARVAHEIRKPLHIIQLAGQAIKNQGNANEKYIQIIQNEVENADRFVNEILNFARPEKLNLTRYSLPELIEKIIKKYQLFTEQQGVRLRFQKDDNIHPFYFDIMKMEEALSNLVQNAIESVAENNGEKEINISVFSEKKVGIYVVISDNGPGFDDETIDKLLDPYFTTKEEGTGLGLSTCYRILTAHGACLKLENTEDHHARITILFPV